MAQVAYVSTIVVYVYNVRGNKKGRLLTSLIYLVVGNVQRLRFLNRNHLLGTFQVVEGDYDRVQVLLELADLLELLWRSLVERDIYYHVTSL